MKSKSLICVVAGILLMLVLVQGVQAAETYSYVRQWGSEGTSDGQFLSPHGLAVNSSGYVYVSDTSDLSTNKCRIQIFNSDGTYEGQWGTCGSVPPGRFDSPQGIDTNSSQIIYIADSGNDKIFVYEPTGTAATQLTSVSIFQNPNDVAVNQSDYVYVSEDFNDKIYIIDRYRTVVGQFGSTGTSDGQFQHPLGVAVNSSGYVYVTDLVLNRIQIFTPDGTYVGQFGSSGSGNGQFNNPYGIAIDAFDNVYVADTFNWRIQKFTADGTYATKWGTFGTGNGQFNATIGIDVDAAGNVFVVDSGNHRIQKFALDKPVADFSAAPLTGPAPQAVQFTDLSTGTGYPNSYDWNFGDSVTTYHGQNPLHTYTSPGVYTVSMRVYNPSGYGEKIIINYITVTSGGIPAPVAAFDYDATHGLTVQFTDTSTGVPTSWSWNFGEGTPSTDQNPSHPYTAAGQYTVTLTATNAGGSDIATKPVTVVVKTNDEAKNVWTPPLEHPNEEAKYATRYPIQPTILTFGGGQPSITTTSAGTLVGKRANRMNGDGPTQLWLVKDDGTTEDLGVPQSLPNNVVFEAEDPYAETNGVTSFSTAPGKIGVGAIEMIPKCSGTSCAHNYAILIDGGKSPADNHIRYWNDISFMYQTLTKVYHYPKANIIVLMSDGPGSGADRHYATVNGVNMTDDSPKDLDMAPDNLDETVYAATSANLHDKIESLGTSKTTADSLFIFTTGHGGNDTQYLPNTNHAIYYLWDGAYISDAAFVTILNDHASGFGSISMVMEQCYGGGFIDNFMTGTQPRYIATAASDEPSYGNSYSNVWTRGMAMMTDRGAPSTEADVSYGDSNGKVGMKEACQFANWTDPSAQQGLTNKEHPTCNSRNFADSGATKYLIDSGDFTSANSVVVTAPNIAETWYSGFSRDITWAKQGSVSTVKIELYNGSGTGNYYPLISSTSASTGKWSWAIPAGVGSIPAPQGTLYKIRINDTANSATTDMSNSYFTIKASGAMGSLKVSSTPAGATIWLDGVSKGTTTTAGTAVANVPPGSHTVTITGPTGDPGYLDQSKGFLLGSGTLNYPVSFTLLPVDKNSLEDTGRTVITSDQVEAEVWIDGQMAGTTPFEKEVLPGTDWKNGNYPRKYTVTVKKLGFKPASQDVEVGRGWTVNQDFPLVPVGFKIGAITATPSTAIPLTPATDIIFSAPITYTTGETHTALWNWDDGSTSPATVSEIGGSGTITGSHIYTTTGVNTVTLTVTDNHGGVDSATYQYAVVYDPDAGYVVGAGSIDSPAGAYKYDQSTGTAYFGFVSKYVRGKSVPSGVTEFYYHAGSMNFLSTNYDWLVINSPRATYKGTGKINGQGNYKFTLTAIDGALQGNGKPDKFRIRITDMDEKVRVYDNMLDVDGDTEPTTVVKCGFIIISKK